MEVAMYGKQMKKYETTAWFWSIITTYFTTNFFLFMQLFYSTSSYHYTLCYVGFRNELRLRTIQQL